MTKPMKLDTLLEGIALRKADDGRWFASCAPLSEVPPHWRLLLQANSTDIPPAPGPVHEPGQEGYNSREEAIAAYYVWFEAEELPGHWRELAAHTEVYPERNAWYLDEIGRLTGGAAPSLSWRTEVYAVTIAVQVGNDQLIDATGNTPDEAIETLYQRVYEWFCQQATLQ
jgi:hypothetical protein